MLRNVSKPLIQIFILDVNTLVLEALATKRKRFFRRVRVGHVHPQHTLEVTNADRHIWRYVATVGVEGMMTGDGVIWMKKLLWRTGRIPLSQSKSVSVGDVGICH